MNYQKTGTEYLGQLLNNPFFAMQDQMIGWWFDQMMLQTIKLYYWPMFLVGVQDNITDLMNPKTYSICRV